MNKLKELLNNLKTKQVVLFYIILVFCLYGNTLSHNYALDDAIVITQNEFTTKGIKGIPDILSHDSFTGFFGKEKKLVEGGRYRPLSIVSFALEYEIWGKNPMASHLINLLIYALTGILIYILIKTLLKQKNSLTFAHTAAFLTGFLFLIHPIHSEAVANIKGRDELLSLLFSVGAFYVTLYAAIQKKNIWLIPSSILLFLGLLSKENAITFLAIIPLGLYFFSNSKIKSILSTTIPLLIASLLFLLLRHQILGGFHNSGSNELLNNPFINATINQKYATIIYTWLIYFKLLIFPHPLTFDYYPYHIPLVNFTNIWVLLSMLAIAALIILAVTKFKRKSILSFSIIGFAASFSIVSNLLFPVGTFMNERFVYAPSLFWCLAIASTTIHFYKKNNNALKYFLLAFLIVSSMFYTAKTIGRNKAWQNDFTLFTTDVKTSHNSAKSNCSAGGKLWEEAKKTTNKKKQQEYFKLSEKYLKNAIKIHPDYVDAWLLLGNLNFDYKQDIENSVLCYIEVLKRQPQNTNAWNNADIVIQNSNNKNEQLKLYNELNTVNNNKFKINYRLGVLYGRYFNKLELGIKHLEKAYKIDSANIEVLKDLGTAYGIKGNETLAYKYSLKALEQSKTDYQVYVNLGVALSKLGKHEEAAGYFKQANALKQKK